MIFGSVSHLGWTELELHAYTISFAIHFPVCQNFPAAN